MGKVILDDASTLLEVRPGELASVTKLQMYE